MDKIKVLNICADMKKENIFLNESKHMTYGKNNVRPEHWSLVPRKDQS